MKDVEKLKQLREETDVSYSMCKEALDQAKGDLEKARQILKKKGAEVAAKKSSRETKEGSVFSYVHHNKKIGSMVELLCETDFVALNDDFRALGSDIAMHIASTDPKDKKKLMASAFIKDPSLTVEQLVKDAILKLGENIDIGRFERFEI